MTPWDTRLLSGTAPTAAPDIRSLFVFFFLFSLFRFPFLFSLRRTFATFCLPLGRFMITVRASLFAYRGNNLRGVDKRIVDFDREDSSPLLFSTFGCE